MGATEAIAPSGPRVPLAEADMRIRSAASEAPFAQSE